MYTCPLIPISFPLGVSSNVCKGIGGRGEKGIGRGRGKGKEGQVRGGEEKEKEKKGKAGAWPGGKEKFFFFRN